MNRQLWLQCAQYCADAHREFYQRWSRTALASACASLFFASLGILMWWITGDYSRPAIVTPGALLFLWLSRAALEERKRRSDTLLEMRQERLDIANKYYPE